MQLTAELSLYPLSEDYETIVLAFIDQLLSGGGVRTVTNSMSTQVSGDAGAVFAAVEQALRASHERFGKQVLVAKFIPEHFGDVLPPP